MTMQDSFKQLNSPNRHDRFSALNTLAAGSALASAPKPWVNMHMHTFFSFNGEGHSPTRLAWEAKQNGLHAAAICDFDVLDGLDEFLQATDRLELRAAVGFESRTFMIISDMNVVRKD